MKRFVWKEDHWEHIDEHGNATPVPTGSPLDENLDGVAARREAQKRIRKREGDRADAEYGTPEEGFGKWWKGRAP